MSGEIATGRIIGQFELKKLLGQGGMGAVYEATDINLQRAVAVKLMRPEAIGREEFRNRFLQEARAIASLDHPNIIRVYTFHADVNEMYLVMEYVQWGSLRGYLDTIQAQGRQVQIKEALALCRHVAAALDYAHQRDMIHRDVKPDNVLLKLTMTSGSTETGFNAVLTDFGLAKLKANPLVQTQENMAMGTLPYMSPEQLKGQQVDGRTDIYAVGVMMYELIVGKRPYAPKKLYDALDMHDRNPPTPPSKAREGVSIELENIIMRAMAKLPEDRFQTGRQLVRGIQEIEGRYTSSVDGISIRAFYDDSKPEERIATYLSSRSEAAPVEASRPGPSAPKGDEIIVSGQDYGPLRIPIKKFPFMIGRDELSDIALPSKKVSRQHLRLERRPDGQYMLIDLKSTNGSFINGNRLTEMVATPWNVGDSLRVGEFELALEIAAAGEPERPLTDRPTLPKKPEGQSAPYQDSPLIRVEPVEFMVMPGLQGEFHVEVQNNTGQTEQYNIRIQNPPRDWRFMPQALSIAAGGRDYVTIPFQLPFHIAQPSGVHELLVEVYARQQATIVGYYTLRFVISAAYDFATDLEPRAIENEGEMMVKISNRGNAADTYAITPREWEAGVVSIEPPTVTLTLEPGEEVHMPFTLHALKRPRMGGAKRYTLEFIIQSSSGGTLTETGHVTVTPRLF